MGVVYVAILVVSQAIRYMLFEHIVYTQDMIGIQSTNALVVLIYDKLFSVSSATNKIFGQGEIVNFIQVDADQLSHICQDLPGII